MCYGTILSESLARAAKSHRCQLCDKVIERGDLMYRQNWKEGGDFSWLKYCETCAAIQHVGAAEDGEGCFIFGKMDATDEFVKHVGWRRVREMVKRLRARLLRKPVDHD